MTNKVVYKSTLLYFTTLNLTCD